MKTEEIPFILLIPFNFNLFIMGDPKAFLNIPAKRRVTVDTRTYHRLQPNWNRH